MRTILWSFAALALLISCSPKPANHSVESTPTYTDFATRLAASGVFGVDLLAADKAMRVAVATQLKSAVVNHYANLELKNRRIKTDDGKPFNSVAHLDRCIEIEANTDDTSDLHFVDRMRICTAAFQDTHFGARARTPMAGVSTGLLLRNVGGRYYITARQTELLKYVRQVTGLTNLDSATAIGNEVLEIDGQPPAQLAAHYEKFVSASTPGARRLFAETSLLSRSFDYPTKKSVQLKIKSPSKTYNYELPWWATTTARNRLDTSEYFQKIGIPVTDRVKMFLDKDEKVSWQSVPIDYEGYLDSNPLVQGDVFRPLVAFKSSSGALAARMGAVLEAPKNFCYAQFLTFTADTLTDPSGQTLPFIEVVRRFVRSCKSAGLDLVMDLRSNNGGNGGYPVQILSFLTPVAATLGNKVMAFRVNSTSARLIANMIEHPEIAARDLGVLDVRFLTELQDAAEAGLEMTNAIPDRAGTSADPSIGGYSGKVVVLVTPACVSACDGMAMILKRSGRAVVLGTHSNGTGAGFMGAEELDSDFNDTYDELSVRIPNYQFGYTSKPFKDLVSLPYLQVADQFFTENIPVHADVIVEPTVGDVFGRENTWLAAVHKALSAP